MKWRILVLDDLGGCQSMMPGFCMTEDDAWKQVAIFHKRYPWCSFAVEGK